MQSIFLHSIQKLKSFFEIQSNDDRYEEEIGPHEKLTANTRLSFDERHIIDDNGQDETSEISSDAETRNFDSQKEG